MKKKKASKVIVFSPGDFLIIRTEDDKKAMFRAEEPSEKGKAFRATLAMDEEKVSHKFFPEDVVVNLGRNPIRAKVLGVDTKRITHTFDNAFLGDKIVAVAHLTEEEQEYAKKGLSKTQKLIKKYGLACCLPLEVEVDKLKTKVAGMAYMRKAEYDKVWINLMGETTFEETFAHELGHIFWSRVIQKPHLKIEWIEHFLQFSEIESFSERDYRKMVRQFIDSGMTIKEFSKSLRGEDEDGTIQKIFNYSVNTLVKTYRVPKPELEIMASSPDARPRLKEIWPAYPVILVQMKDNHVSEYSKTNVVEFFCECFRVYTATSQKLPKRTRRLMEKTLEACAHSNRRIIEDPTIGQVPEED